MCIRDSHIDGLLIFSLHHLRPSAAGMQRLESPIGINCMENPQAIPIAPGKSLGL